MTALPDGDRDGDTYRHSADFQRLNGQARRVFLALVDHAWHTLHEIAAATGDPEASVSARLRDLRKRRFGAWIVQRQRVERGLWRYRLTGEQIEPEPSRDAEPEPEQVTIAVTRSAGGQFSKHTRSGDDQPSLFA